jgi:hypothetical protein
MSYWNGTYWSSDPPAATKPPKRSRRLLGAALEASLIVLLMFGLIAGTALAAKGDGNRGGGGKPGGGTGSLTMVPMDGATEAHFGARVTFEVSTTATPYPYVHLMCYQNGALVGEGRQGFFPTALGNEWFSLGPTPSWQGGAAECTANLEQSTKRGWSVLGSTQFSVFE